MESHQLASTLMQMPIYQRFIQPKQNIPPIIIDIEASGFGAGSYPVEIAVVLPNSEKHNFLVKPAPEWTSWDREAEQTHGIHRGLLEDWGLPIDEVAWRLNRLLEGQTVYSDGWSFDLSWLGRLYEQAQQPQCFRLESLTQLLSQEHLCHWDRVKRQVICEIGLKRHRASSDAMILQKTYLRVKHDCYLQSMWSAC